MAKSSKPAAEPAEGETLSQLDLSLSAFEPRSEIAKELQAAVEKAITASLELASASDEQLALTDTQHHSRINYVLTLLTVRDLLRDPTFDKKSKASLALGYLKHAEDTKFAAQGIGRSKGDEALKSEVEKARADMQRLAETKARILGNDRVN
jgi:hypothetical protein